MSSTLSSLNLDLSATLDAASAIASRHDLIRELKRISQVVGEEVEGAAFDFV